MAQAQRYDWQKIRSEYETGTFSDAELCRRHGCSRAVLQRHRDREGWKRDLAADVKRTVSRRLIEEDAGGGAGAGAPRDAKSDQEAVEWAAETRLNVIRLHRRDIKQLRELETKLIEELSGNPTKLYLAQYQGEIIEKTVALTAAERAMAANNLANVQHKRIQLERQAFNLSDDGSAGEGPEAITITTRKGADEKEDP